MNLAEQLTEFVLNYDIVQSKDVPKEHIAKVFQTLIDKNRIILSQDFNGNLYGFVESWRINYQQLGWLMCHPKNHPNLDHWNIEDGNICYLANIVIKPEFRKGWVARYFKQEFFKKNYMCEFFMGEALRKKHKPVKIFDRQEFYDKYASKEVVQSGKR